MAERIRIGAFGSVVSAVMGWVLIPLSLRLTVPIRSAVGLETRRFDGRIGFAAAGVAVCLALRVGWLAARQEANRLRSLDSDGY